MELAGMGKGDHRGNQRGVRIDWILDIFAAQVRKKGREDADASRART